MATTYQATNACTWRDDSGGRWIPHITQDIRQGEFSSYGENSGVMIFDLTSIRATYADYEPTGATLRLTRTGSGSYNSTLPMKLYAGNQVSIPAVSNNSSTAAARPTKVTSGYNYNISGGQGAKSTVITTALIESIADTSSNCIFMDYTSSSTNYMSFTGRNDLTKIELDITWEARIPAPTDPIPNTPATSITTASKNFSWTASTDHIYASSALFYEWQISEDNGSSWSATQTSAEGAANITIDIKTLYSLTAGQYYYQTDMKYRVRAKTPLYSGSYYYSSWASSTNFTVDYSIEVSAPGDPDFSDITPYEGELVTIGMDRPATYNTHDAAGAGNILRYNFVNEETYAVWGWEDNAVTVDPVSLDWTISEVTTAKTDLAATFSSWAYDAESGGTRSTPPVAVTIKRYQKPIIVISDITRTTTTATMDIIVSDTGYGVTQVNTQILKVEYNLASAGWLDASLIGWSGLENSFQLTGLTEGARYALQIRVTNNKPVPALADKVSSIYSGTILEYTPAFFVFSDAGDSVSGTAHKALLVHSDFSTAVGAGSAVIENDLEVSGTITEGGNAVWHAGNLNKPTRTLLWSGSQVPTADTMSYSDTDTYDFFTIHLTSNVNAAHHTDIMTRAGGYTYLTVNEYHVSKDSVWRNYGSYMSCTTYTGAWLVKNIYGVKINNTL